MANLYFKKEEKSKTNTNLHLGPCYPWGCGGAIQVLVKVKTEILASCMTFQDVVCERWKEGCLNSDHCAQMFPTWLSYCSWTCRRVTDHSSPFCRTRRYGLSKLSCTDTCPHASHRWGTVGLKDHFQSLSWWKHTVCCKSHCQVCIQSLWY